MIACLCHPQNYQTYQSIQLHNRDLLLSHCHVETAVSTAPRRKPDKTIYIVHAENAILLCRSRNAFTIRSTQERLTSNIDIPFRKYMKFMLMPSQIFSCLCLPLYQNSIAQPPAHKSTADLLQT